MTFTSPNLTTSISANSYQVEIDNNFALIQSSLDSLQSLLTSGTLGASSALKTVVNMSHLSKLGEGSGVVGEDSFVLSFTGNVLPQDPADQHTLKITHPSTAETSNAVFTEAVLGGEDGVGDAPRWYVSDTAYSLDLRSLVNADGEYTMVCGLVSVGSPHLSYKVAIGTKLPNEDTNFKDAGFDLPLYQFKFTITGADSGPGTDAYYVVSDVRRLCPVLVSHDSWDNVYEGIYPLNVVMPDPLAWEGYQKSDAMNSEGFVATVGGLIIPWDCQVMGAYVHVETLGSQVGTDGFLFHLYNGSYRHLYPGSGHDFSEVVDGPVFLDSQEDETAPTTYMGPTSPPTILTAGTFVQPAIGPEFGGAPYTDPPQGLTITLLIKRNYLSVYSG